MTSEALPKIFMIVDDDKDDRYFFRRAIKIINPLHVCIEAEQGADALTKLSEMSVLPDYIFLDLNMPIMDGKQFLRELKSDNKFNKLPVIIYSTSSYEKDKITTRALGACHYIVKCENLAAMPAEIMHAIEVAESYAL